MRRQPRSRYGSGGAVSPLRPHALEHSFAPVRQCAGLPAAMRRGDLSTAAVGRRGDEPASRRGWQVGGSEQTDDRFRVALGPAIDPQLPMTETAWASAMRPKAASYRSAGSGEPEPQDPVPVSGRSCGPAIDPIQPSSLRRERSLINQPVDQLQSPATGS